MTQNTIRKFTDLIAWKEAHILVLFIYKETEYFPPNEVFGIVNQMRRAAVSISSNIAEGFGRTTSKDKMHFYTMAKTSLAEIENQVIISRDLGYLNKQKSDFCFTQLEKTDRLIAGLYRSASSR